MAKPRRAAHCLAVLALGLLAGCRAPSGDLNEQVQRRGHDLNLRLPLNPDQLPALGDWTARDEAGQTLPGVARFEAGQGELKVALSGRAAGALARPRPACARQSATVPPPPLTLVAGLQSGPIPGESSWLLERRSDQGSSWLQELWVYSDTAWRPATAAVNCQTPGQAHEIWDAELREGWSLVTAEHLNVAAGERPRVIYRTPRTPGLGGGPRPSVIPWGRSALPPHPPLPPAAPPTDHTPN